MREQLKKEPRGESCKKEEKRYLSEGVDEEEEGKREVREYEI